METRPPGIGPAGIDASSDVDEPIPPDTTPTTTTTYWQANSVDARSRGSRVADALLSVAAFAALVVLGNVAVAGRPFGDAERYGYQVGVILAGVGIGLAARWLYRRNRDTTGTLTRMLSPWLVLGAIVVMVPTLGQAATRTPADPNTALRISGGFSLTEVEPTVLLQIETEYAEGVRRGLGAMAIRQVDGQDGSLSYLMVFDGAFAPDADLSEIARGVADTADGEPTFDSIGGQAVALVTTPAQSIVTWIESPFEIMILGADETTARDVATAVLAAPTR